MKLQPGTLLQGDRYRIIDVLGQGGFGITYLAEQVMAERKVCIKEFFPKEYYNRNEDSRSISLGSQGSAEIMELYKAKFIKEAKTIAKLDHPNIIHIFDVFAENNTAYYVMEYIDGESLSTLVKSRGVLPESEAISYIKQVAAALGSIHEQRIMHLDIKPANVMLRKEDGRVVLIDFGLSKQYDADGNQTSSTPVGISAGYAPMEQYQQGGVREFSPETDIYSLGATLYYLVTGVVPPQAAAIVDDGLPELPAHLSANVRNAIERSMEVQRKRRPHSIKEFLALLEDNNPVVVPTPKPTPAPVSEETAFGAPASNAADKCTAVGTTTPKAQPTQQPKKEWTPKYSTEKPKKSEEPKKKKSRWWMWLLGLLLIGGGAYFIIGANSRKNTEPTEEGKIAAQTNEICERIYVAACEKDWVSYLVAESELECIDHTLKSGSDAKKAFEEAVDRWEVENSDKCEVISNFWTEAVFDSDFYLINQLISALRDNNDNQIKRLLHPDCYHDIEKLKLQCSMFGLGNPRLVGAYKYKGDSVEQYIIAAEVDENINVRDIFSEHERAEDYISPSGYVFLYENLYVVDYNGEKRIWTNADMLTMDYAEKRLSWSGNSIPSCYYQGDFFSDR